MEIIQPGIRDRRVLLKALPANAAALALPRLPCRACGPRVRLGQSGVLSGPVD